MRINELDIIQEFKLFHDRGDKWGEAFALTFDICTYAYNQDFEIPSELGYSPGLGASEIDDSYYFELYHSLDSETIYNLLRFLHRYLDLLRYYELDY